MSVRTQRVIAGVLDVTYLESGPADGTPVFLMHGFPYDVHAYTEVANQLAEAGLRVLVPYLRGYGPTRFLDASTPRSGEQAVLANDLLALMDALNIERALVAGYDWGGRAACIVSALRPERVIGLVSGEGYNLQNIARSGEPATPAEEHRYWYQYYFHAERGRAGLSAHRHDLCKLLWQLWSPSWSFSDDTYNRSAEAFDNPDFVDVVIHSYRHRYALVDGDPAVADIERSLIGQPTVCVPTIAVFGETDGVAGFSSRANDAPHFTGPYHQLVLPNVGHNPPQEAPREFADAILSLMPDSTSSPDLPQPGA
jgi:pimeloyl-ACP methyl ester carboxylesterase